MYIYENIISNDYYTFYRGISVNFEQYFKLTYDTNEAYSVELVKLLIIEIKDIENNSC